MLWVLGNQSQVSDFGPASLSLSLRKKELANHFEHLRVMFGCQESKLMGRHTFLFLMLQSVLRVPKHFLPLHKMLLVFCLILRIL